MNDSTPGDVRPSSAPFGSTQWSVVLAARGDSPDGRAALEKLCRAYWQPLYAYLRRRGQSPADAEDLVQGFFVCLFETEFLHRPDPEKGRFRGYLVGALKHYLADHFERMGAQKRGGKVEHLGGSLEEAERFFLENDQPALDPADAYEKSWALTLLNRALVRLEAEQADPVRRNQFEVLRPFLSTAPGRGEYDSAAIKLGTTRTNVAVWIHRLNQRYAELVRLEVAETVSDPAEVKAEMRHLLQALRR